MRQRRDCQATEDCSQDGQGLLQSSLFALWDHQWHQTSETRHPSLQKPAKFGRASLRKATRNLTGTALHRCRLSSVLVVRDDLDKAKNYEVDEQQHVGELGPVPWAIDVLTHFVSPRQPEAVSVARDSNARSSALTSVSL